LKLEIKKHLKASDSLNSRIESKKKPKDIPKAFPIIDVRESCVIVFPQYLLEVLSIIRRLTAGIAAENIKP